MTPADGVAWGTGDRVLEWFRRHVAAQRILLYLSFGAVLWIVTRDLAGTAVLTTAFVLADDAILELLPARWDRRRASGSRAWVFVGLLVGFGASGPLWIAWFPLGLAVLVVVLRRASLRASLDVGVLLGLAAASGCLAWVNRDGPGEVCRSSGTDRWCTTYLDPRLLALAAVASALAAVAVQLRRVRRLRPRTEVPA